MTVNKVDHALHDDPSPQSDTKNIHQVYLGVEKLLATKPQNFVDPQVREKIDSVIEDMSDAVSKISDQKIASSLSKQIKDVRREIDAIQQGNKQQGEDLFTIFHSTKNYLKDIVHFDMKQSHLIHNEVSHWVADLDALGKQKLSKPISIMNPTESRLHVTTTTSSIQPSAPSARVASTQNSLINKPVPLGPKPYTQGTLHFSWSDGKKDQLNFLEGGLLTYDIRYAPYPHSENPNERNLTIPPDQFWENSKKSLANLYLSQNKDVIFLSRIPDKAKIEELMNIEIKGKKLSDTYGYINSPDGAILYNKSKLSAELKQGHIPTGETSSGKTRSGETRSYAQQVVDKKFMSLFALTFKDNPSHTINVFVGESPTENTTPLQQAILKYSDPNIPTIAAGDFQEVDSLHSLPLPQVQESDEEKFRVPNDKIFSLAQGEQNVSLSNAQVLINESLYHYGEDLNAKTNED